MLRQLGNSFIVQPDVLKTYMTESHLGRIDPVLLRPYLAQRSDYAQFSRSLNLDEGPVGLTESASAGSNGAAAGAGGGAGAGVGLSGVNLIGGIGRSAKLGSRLSTMSGVAGAGMGKLKEMLKEFEALSPEEVEVARKNARAGGMAARSGQGAMPMPIMYMGMH
jgi:hypothetical protein